MCLQQSRALRHSRVRGNDASSSERAFNAGWDDSDEGAQVTFTSGLTGGVLSACAGALANDDVHSASAEVLEKRDGQILPNAELVFSFKDNIGNPNKAKFINEQEQVVETLTRTTNNEGKTNITVLSSVTVSAPQI